MASYSYRAFRIRERWGLGRSGTNFVLGALRLCGGPTMLWGSLVSPFTSSPHSRTFVIMLQVGFDFVQVGVESCFEAHGLDVDAGHTRTQGVAKYQSKYT